MLLDLIEKSSDAYKATVIAIILKEHLEIDIGFEPMTTKLTAWSSTSELINHIYWRKVMELNHCNFYVDFCLANRYINLSVNLPRVVV